MFLKISGGDNCPVPPGCGSGYTLEMRRSGWVVIFLSSQDTVSDLGRKLTMSKPWFSLLSAVIFILKLIK